MGVCPWYTQSVLLDEGVLNFEYSPFIVTPPIHNLEPTHPGSRPPYAVSTGTDGTPNYYYQSFPSTKGSPFLSIPTESIFLIGFGVYLYQN